MDSRGARSGPGFALALCVTACRSGGGETAGNDLVPPPPSLADSISAFVAIHPGAAMSDVVGHANRLLVRLGVDFDLAVLDGGASGGPWRLPTNRGSMLLTASDPEAHPCGEVFVERVPVVRLSRDSMRVAFSSDLVNVSRGGDGVLWTFELDQRARTWWYGSAPSGRQETPPSLILRISDGGDLAFVAPDAKTVSPDPGGAAARVEAVFRRLVGDFYDRFDGAAIISGQFLLVYDHPCT